MRKVCSRCKEEKDATEFSLGGKRPGVLRAACRACEARYRKEYRAYNRQRLRISDQQRLRELWRVTYAVYGGRCGCCGETRLELLTLDHVFNDGAFQREFNGEDTKKILRRIKKSGRPEPGIALLCYSCNCARFRCGECPHVAERKQLLEKIVPRVKGVTRRA